MQWGAFLSFFLGASAIFIVEYVYYNNNGPDYEIFGGKLMMISNLDFLFVLLSHRRGCEGISSAI